MKNFRFLFTLTSLAGGTIGAGSAGGGGYFSRTDPGFSPTTYGKRKLVVVLNQRDVTS